VKPRILLVKSRSVVTKNAGVTPPLGLLYLAAVLQRDLGARVRVVDALFEPDVVAVVRRAVREEQPHAVGISALTAEAFLAGRIAEAAKAELPGVPVILGGPHPSSDPEAALADPAIDVAVLGEGELTLRELVQHTLDAGPAWASPAALRGIPGLAFRGEAGVELSPPRAPIDDLDGLPFPAWDLIDYRRFWKRQSMATAGIRPYLTMFTSRGCPYRCVFCHQLFGKRFRARSPENVADEVASLLRRGAGHVEMLDDIANFRRERFDRMLEVLLERGLHPHLSFPNAIRADLLREESLDLLKRVGVGEVSVAIETASLRLQKMLCKNLDLGRASDAIDALARRRIFTRGFFMLGFPSETRAELLSTIHFAHASRLHLALFFTPNPYRNTPLYEMYREAGKLPARTSTIDYEYYGAPFNASEVPDAEYRALYRWAYLGFYASPRRAWRIARDRPLWSDIPTRAYLLARNSSSFRRLKED
jgi:radical SAM superfamily enzyme YgiQ (UPF0313 family)